MQVGGPDGPAYSESPDSAPPAPGVNLKGSQAACCSVAAMHWTPLARRAYDELRQEGPLTQKELLGRLGCARRSLFSALGILSEAGLVERRPDLTDMRRSLLSAAERGERQG